MLSSEPAPSSSGFRWCSVSLPKLSGAGWRHWRHPVHRERAGCVVVREHGGTLRSRLSAGLRLTRPSSLLTAAGSLRSRGPDPAHCAKRSGYRRQAPLWSLAYWTTAERSKEIAVGRTEASATSLRATRGTSTRSAPTAERSHCLKNGKQHDDGHDIACDARFSGTEDATAPRSDRGGRRYRGSRVLVALAPATHGYLLRPLRGRGATPRRRP